MWRSNRDYLLLVRFWLLGCSETVVLRHEEGSACSWTSFTPWLRLQNPEQRRRVKRWYRDVSGRNASTAWRTISIFCKNLSFFSSFFAFECHIYNSSDFLWIFPLAISSRIRWRIDRSPDRKECTICTLTAALSQNNLWLIQACFRNQIFTYASPNATLSEQLSEKIQSSGLGLVTKWSPQQFILNHPVSYPIVVTYPISILRIP